MVMKILDSKKAVAKISLISFMMISLLFLMFFAGGVFAQESGNTLTVNQTGYNNSLGEYVEISNPIQSAINNASEGDTIEVGAGTYAETLNLKGKPLTIVGAGNDETIVNASGESGYAISSFGSSTTINNLKLIGSDHYGFKISSVSDIILENIVVENSGKTGIDLNTVDGATLNNVEVRNTTSGFGLMILDSNDVTVTDVTTSNNPWGGVSVHAIDKDAENIEFEGEFNTSEDIPLLLEKDHPYDGDFVNISTPEKFEYVVYGLRKDNDYRQWFYKENLEDAKTLAQTLMDDWTYEDMIIYDLSEENYYVIEGMLIQDAINAASDGDTIEVGAGIYEENDGLHINRSLTINGFGHDQTIIKVSRPSSGYGIRTSSNSDLEFALSNMTFEAVENITNFFFHIAHNKRFDLENINVIGMGQEYYSPGDEVWGNTVGGVDIINVENSTYKNVNVSKTSRNSVSFSAVKNIDVENIYISNSGAREGSAGIAIYNRSDYIDNNPKHININFGEILGLPIGINLFDGSDYETESFNISNLNLENNDIQAVVSDEAEFLLANNDFDRAVVIRGSPIKVPIIFSSIQDAIDAASDGDVIDVEAGTYEEDLFFHPSKKGLELKGANSSNTIIQGVSVGVPGVPNINIHADDMKIHGFTIKTADGRGSWVDGLILNAVNVEIFDNVFKVISSESTGNGGASIQTWRNENALLQNTQYSFNPERESNISGLKIYNNTFSNEGGERYMPLWINYDAGSGLIDIFDNIMEGDIHRAIRAERSNVNILNNKINSSWKGSSGIIIYDWRDNPNDQKNINLSGNTLEGFSTGLILGGQGDTLQLLEDVNVANNLISNNDRGILVLSSAQGIKINKNKILKNTEYEINNTDDKNLNAEKNYWGSPLPDFSELIFGNVTYEPWCLNEGCNSSSEVFPTYTNISIKLPYFYNESNNYWFNITLEDDSGVDNASLLLKYPGDENFTEIFLINVGDEWYYNITNLSAGNYQYRFWANDTLGNKGNITKLSRFTVADLTGEDVVFDDNESYSVPENKTNVVVEDTSKIKEIKVSKNNTGTTTITFNNRPDNTVKFTNNVSIRRSTSNLNLSVDIPENTSMNSSEDWDGKFKLPEVVDVTESGKDISLAISVGSDSKIDFDNAVKVLLPNQKGKQIGWKRGGSSVTEISRCGTTGGVVQKPDSGSSCYYDDGNDVIVWTYHFTDFLAYEDEEPVTTTSSGGGGGTTIIYLEPNETEEVETPEVPEEESVPEVVEESDEESEETSRGFLTGLVVGAGEGETTNRVTMWVIIALLGLTLYYRSFTITGLSKRAEKLHKKADAMNREGKYDVSLNVRNKARKLQRKADKKSY